MGGQPRRVLNISSPVGRTLQFAHDWCGETAFHHKLYAP